MKKIHSLFILILLATLTSCYPLEDDEFALVPTTNNPSVTNAKPNSPMPAIGY
jgi:hypothetical protein